MPPVTPTTTRKNKVDKDLKRISALERATLLVAQPYVGIGLSLLFLLTILALTTLWTWGVTNSLFIVIAAVVGGYMALNIGANDVANNVGPAVGAKALTMGGALAIAAICEAAGALLAGGDVVNTISKGIIDPSLLPNAHSFIFAMTAALLAGALWVNLATYVGAPVSTTHAIVGGVVGAGVMAAGTAAANWSALTGIAASWVISPVLGALIAILFYYLIQTLILAPEDKLAAAQRWVPVLVAIMAASFTFYLITKGLQNIWKPALWLSLVLTAAVYGLTYFGLQPRIAQRARSLENRAKSIDQLFTVPLIGSAALLSFAHGANDVANAVGPLAAVVASVHDGGIAAQVHVPLWVMLVGAVGISAGLLLFGPRVIYIVGEEITRLNPKRAFCVALSAAITVIAASALGLPVSSTHIAVGGVFGIGFFREWQTNRRSRTAPALLEDVENLSPTEIIPDEVLIKRIEKARKRRLVRRNHLMNIAAAWIVTVPVSAVLAAGLYWLLVKVL